jgi:hypothetical protein
MQDTPMGRNATTLVGRPWLPAQGEWTYRDWLKLPDDGYRYEGIEGVLSIGAHLHQYGSSGV